MGYKNSECMYPWLASDHTLAMTSRIMRIHSLKAFKLKQGCETMYTVIAETIGPGSSCCPVLYNKLNFSVVVLGISDRIVITRIGVPICLRTKVIKLHHMTGTKPQGFLLTRLIQRLQLQCIEAGSSSSSHPPDHENPVTACEKILRTHRCQQELGLLNSPDTHMSTVTASGVPTAISPSLELDVVVGSVVEIAMVYTDSQSSIISQSLLHKIGR